MRERGGERQTDRDRQTDRQTETDRQTDRLYWNSVLTELAQRPDGWSWFDELQLHIC